MVNFFNDFILLSSIFSGDVSRSNRVSSSFSYADTVIVFRTRTMLIYYLIIISNNILVGSANNKRRRNETHYM